MERKTKATKRVPLRKTVVRVKAKQPLRRVAVDPATIEGKAEALPEERKPAKKISFGSKIRAAKTKTEEGGYSHLIVEARAGTGKTFTLVEGLKRIMDRPTPGVKGSEQQEEVWREMVKGPKPASCAFVAFNKSIAKELSTKVPRGASAMTMHGMGFRALSRAFKNLGEPTNKTAVLLEQITGEDIRELRREKPTLVKAVSRLVQLCKMNLAEPDEETLEGLAGHYEVDLESEGGRDYSSEVFSLVPRVLEEARKQTWVIDFDDMIWLPVVLGLPIYRYDLLLVDEAQDLNRCQQALAIRAGKRLILCGDPCQAIYGFAGADTDSIPRMQSALGETPEGCKTLPLTMTRRCGRTIVEEARAIVPDFEAWRENCEGQVLTASFEEYAKTVQDGDMVLCRVNAPLVSQCFRFIKEGKKANIQGRDIGEGLIKLVEGFNAVNVADLCGKIDDWYVGESAKENSRKNPSEDKLIALQDRRDCLLAFAEGASSLREVTDKINRLFSDDRTGGILLSSVHRAKGLERRRVFILTPKGAGMPHPMARSGWQVRQEYNLRYVAITRAIETLVWVVEKKPEATPEVEPSEAIPF